MYFTIVAANTVPYEEGALETGMTKAERVVHCNLHGTGVRQRTTKHKNLRFGFLSIQTDAAVEQLCRIHK